MEKLVLTFRKHLEKDIPYRVKWFKNPKVTELVGDSYTHGTTLKKEQEWFARYQKDKNKKFFTICDGPKPIGIVGLSNISKQNKNADLFIAIGDDDYRGKGFGKIAMKWIIEYGFKKLKLRKIKLGVIADNAPAVKLYKSAGFIIEGKIKDEIFRHGRFYDELIMAIFNI